MARSGIPYIVLYQGDPTAQTTAGPYWRASGTGYTNLIVEAGLYTSRQALLVCKGTHGNHQAYRIDSPKLQKYLDYWEPARGSELRLWLQLRAVAPAWELVRPRETATEPPPFGARCFVYHPFQNAGWLNAGYEEGYDGEGPMWVDGGGMQFPAVMFKWWVPELGEPTQVKAWLADQRKHHQKIIKAHKAKQA